jgi:hypothetical protein
VTDRFHAAHSLTDQFFTDQKAIWMSPLHLKTRDAAWLAPLAAGTLAALATDHRILRHVGSSPIPHSNSFGNYGVAALAGSAAALYFDGYLRRSFGKDRGEYGLGPSAAEDRLHRRESGWIAGEALVHSAIVNESLKLVFQRQRPNAGIDGSGTAARASFPSEHATAAWAVASVLAQEYPGPLTKLLVYGAASGISVSRITARQHYPSDVVVGSALGYLIGRYEYRAHHDPSLPGARGNTWDPASFEPVSRGENKLRLRNPANFASPSVPLDSWIYAALDRLAALGYAPSAFTNLRPWTRMECARLVVAAGEDMGSVTGDHPPEAYSLRAALGAEFSGELGLFWNTDPSRHGAPAYRASDSKTAVDGTTPGSARVGGLGDGARHVNPYAVSIDSLYTRYTNIAGTPLDDSYHFGQTLSNDFGRPYGQGSNLVSGASASGTAGPVAFYLRGEYQRAAALPAYSPAIQQLLGNIDLTPPQLPVHTAVVKQLRLLDAYATWNIRSVQVTAGRQSLWWGPGRGGPPNLSDNAEPIDMVRLANPSPWQLPGFLRWLGPMRWDFFAGFLSGHHYPASTAIDGQKISFKPTPNLEFGFSRTIIFHPVTLGMFWKGLSSFGDNKSTTPGSLADVGDRRGGFDFRYRLPGLRKWVTIYNDGMTDDDTSPLGAPQRALMNPGVYLPQIPYLPKLDFRAEAVWSDPPALSSWKGRYFYYNGAYHDAYTNGGRLLGSWVGREGHGFQLWSTYWLSPRSTLQTGYRHAHVDRDFIPGGGNMQDFSVRADIALRPELEMAAFVQYERWNFSALAPLAGPNTAASVEFIWHPRWRKEWLRP